MIKVAVVGGSGYSGAELLRLLAHHPEAQLEVVTSHSEAGARVSDVYPNLRGTLDLVFAQPSIDSLKDCELVFFATTPGKAMHWVPELLDEGCRVIDLSADFRLRDISTWLQWYKIPHEAESYLAQAEYGLPEWNAETIQTANLVANPGCYPTAIALGIMPLLEAEVIHPQGIIADCKSGHSGAGRQARARSLLAESHENVHAYGLDGHRHFPEIQQILAEFNQGNPVEIVFVPHLVPTIRGIFATLYLTSLDEKTDFHSILADRYQHSPFIEVLAPGTSPGTRNVRGTNRCEISVKQDPHSSMVMVLVALDNLMKGAAGQAVQNMNIMFGLPPATGLNALAVLP